jgi:hypothetical protein
MHQLKNPEAHSNYKNTGSIFKKLFGSKWFI